MRRIAIVSAVVASALALQAGRAGAQVFTPTYMGPRPASDFGVYVADFGDLAIEGIWRRISRGGDIGLRAGYADLGDGALLLGIEVRNPVTLAGSPIGLAFTAGAQGVLGDETALGGQVGFTAGQAIPTPNVVITPYIHPRLAVANRFITDAEDDEFGLEVLADLGVDLDFTNGIVFRVGANLGAGADWGVGISWRQ
ncbi:MAG TPA: hypothetical protein VNP72_02145 [Longimicrobium sp.]|nr:hypothetical protein [Longimicrobium sp.]